MRTARYFTIGASEGEGRVQEIWIACHGFAQLASRFLSRFELVATESRLIVAPEALNRFYLDTSPRPHGPEAKIGATWMTREDRDNEIRDYVRYLDQVAEAMLKKYASGSTRLMIFGFSQGVTTASRWFTHGSVKPDAVVLWSGHLPFDHEVESSADKWRSTPVYVVWGDADARANAPGIERDRVRFEANGVRPTPLEFSGGHELDAGTLLQLAAMW